MSDDRLFASNNALGRRWYYLNLVILVIITICTHYLFTNYVIPNVTKDVYETIANGIMYLAYAVYIITFFALVDRRLFDICGKRDTKGYKNTSFIIWTAVILQLFCFYYDVKHPAIPVPFEIISFAAVVFDMASVLIVFVLGLIKGKISNLSYEQYRNKIKYD